MFEYINPGFYILSGILLSMALILIGFNRKKNKHTYPKKSFPTFGIAILLIAITTPLLLSYNTKNTIDENIETFKQNELLKCKTLTDSYLVSIVNSWKISQDGFVRDSLFIRADQCQSVDDIIE